MRQQECLHLELRITDQGVQGRWNQLVETEHGKIADALLAGHLDRRGNGRSRGLEADAQKHDLVVGVVLGDRTK